MDIKDLKNGINSDENSFYFKAKNELIYGFISKLNKQNLKILILGIGPSSSLSSLNKYGNVYATDIDEKALKFIPNNVFFKKQKVDVCNIPFKDNFFDIIIGCDILEHVKKDKIAVLNIYKCLKKNGIFIGTVPAFNFLFSSHDKALGHIRRYSKKDLNNLFLNFKKIKLTYWNFFIFPFISIIRILKKNSKPKVDKININSSFIDSLLYYLLKIENFLVKYISLPYGLSLFMIYKK